MTEEQRIVQELGDTVTGMTDFCGEKQPSFLFRFMVRMMCPRLSCEPDKMISKGSIRIRKMLHPLLPKILPAFLEYRQVIERTIEIPSEPVIWCP